jgi:hypothetical protein
MTGFNLRGGHPYNSAISPGFLVKFASFTMSAAKRRASLAGFHGFQILSNSEK